MRLAAASAVLGASTTACLCAATPCFWSLPSLGRGRPETERAAAAAVAASAPDLGRRAGLLGAGLLPAFGALPPPGARAISRDERRVAALFLEAAPSVLGIAEAERAGGRLPVVAGSGFVWDKTHVVTNYHVVDDMSNPHITFLTRDAASGEERRTTLSATLVGADPLSDIAVLEVQGEAELLDTVMRPLQRGASGSLRPGQEVYALGNPFGLEHSMSKGVISGVSRTMEGAAGRPITNVIQTDASINPGNSGGPLLDSEGTVIGVNAAILSTSGTFAGVGLAIPIDTVEHNVASMISNGYVSRPSLGVVFAPQGLSEVLGIGGGAMVMKVFPGSPAQKAGVRAMRKGRLGDVIVGFAGTPVSTSEDLFRILEQRAPGEDVVMQVRRVSADVESDGFDYVDVKVRLGLSNSKLVNV